MIDQPFFEVLEIKGVGISTLLGFLRKGVKRNNCFVKPFRFEEIKKNSARDQFDFQ